MSQKQRVLNFLRNGGELTDKYAERRGIGNVYEVVRQLREEGNPIYLNTRANGKSFYRLGTASKAMVASAFAVRGANAFR